MGNCVLVRQVYVPTVVARDAGRCVRRALRRATGMVGASTKDAMFKGGILESGIGAREVRGGFKVPKLGGG